MFKQFDDWNGVKKKLEVHVKELFFKEGEVWWVSLGLNVANEICGKGETFVRPVLILRKLSKESCIVLPLTSKEKKGSWFKMIMMRGQKNWILLYQIRFLSINRFQKRIGVIQDHEFLDVKKELKEVLRLF